MTTNTNDSAMTALEFTDEQFMELARRTSGYDMLQHKQIPAFAHKVVELARAAQQSPQALPVEPPVVLDDATGERARFYLAMTRDAQAMAQWYGDRLLAVTRWLEINQPDVFRRGLWDAVKAATPSIRPEVAASRSPVATAEAAPGYPMDKPCTCRAPSQVFSSDCPRHKDGPNRATPTGQAEAPSGVAS